MGDANRLTSFNFPQNLVKPSMKFNGTLWLFLKSIWLKIIKKVFENFDHVTLQLHPEILHLKTCKNHNLRCQYDNIIDK